MQNRLIRILRPIGPAVPHAPAREALRAGCGAALGLLLAGMAVVWAGVDHRLGLYLIAPFGASAVLLFAAPNSPLAQPWSAVVGNCVSALVGVLACLYLPDPSLRVAVAVGLAILVMVLLRALHPPGGAVAMTAALSPEQTLDLGWYFAFAPVGLGTVLLVATAMLYAPLTGRRYPFRQLAEANARGTLDPDPLKRIGLSEAELVALLERYNQSLNLGVADLARLIGAAEQVIAAHNSPETKAGEIMSRDLITIAADTPLAEAAALFQKHGFTSLPVVDGDNRLLGVIFQIHLIRSAADLQPRNLALDVMRGRSRPPLAGEVMARNLPRCSPDTAIATLLPLMAEGHCDAVPVTVGERLVGIVTRTDVIAALARHSLPPSGNGASGPANAMQENE